MADELKIQAWDPKLFQTKYISKNSSVFNSSHVRFIFSGQSKDLFIQESPKKVEKVLSSHWSTTGKKFEGLGVKWAIFIGEVLPVD